MFGTEKVLEAKFTPRLCRPVVIEKNGRRFILPPYCFSPRAGVGQINEVSSLGSPESCVPHASECVSCAK